MILADTNEYKKGMDQIIRKFRKLLILTNKKIPSFFIIEIIDNFEGYIKLDVGFS
jgi:hypothetical protein